MNTYLSRFPHYTKLCITTLLMCISNATLAVEDVENRPDRYTVGVKLSAGSSWQVRNDVQIPNSTMGSRFSLADEVGEGPLPAVRLEINWSYKERHGLRVMLAPLTYTESVSFDENIRFDGNSFSANEPVDATYKFNSWRFGYHYLLRASDKSSVKVGFTLKVRDAEIRLEQAGTISSNDNIGLVPLLYLAGTRKISDRFTIGADIDGLAGGPGRAIDLGVSLDYALGSYWSLGAEARVLDGGADTDTVYNFAQFNSASLFLAARF